MLAFINIAHLQVKQLLLNHHSLHCF